MLGQLATHERRLFPPLLPRPSDTRYLNCNQVGAMSAHTTSSANLPAAGSLPVAASAVSRYLAPCSATPRTQVHCSRAPPPLAAETALP